MISRCSGESLVKASRSISPWCFFSRATSAIVCAVGHSGLDRLVKLRIGPTAAGRERLEAGDREQPSGDGGTAFKAASLLPHVEEHVAQKVLGHGLVADEPEQPTINRGAMAGEQHLHGELVARCDALNQHFVGGIFACRGCNRRHCGGGRARPNIRLMHVISPSHVPPKQAGGEKSSGIYFFRRQEPAPSEWIKGGFVASFVRRLAALTNGRIDDLIRGLAMMACDAGAGAPSSHSPPRELPRARRDVPPSWRSARTSRILWARILGP